MVKKEGHGEVVTRLMNKVAQQAADLKALNDAYEESVFHGKQCEKRISDLEESLFAQTRNDGPSSNKHFEVEDFYKNRLSKAELEVRTSTTRTTKMEVDQQRLCELVEKRTCEANKWRALCTELRADNEALSMRRGAALSERYSDSAEGSTSASVLQVMQDNLKRSELRAEDLAQKVENERRLREDAENESFVLQNALNSRLSEEGLTQHHDLVAMVAKLRGELSALHDQHRAKCVLLGDCESAKASVEEKGSKLAAVVDQQKHIIAQLEKEVNGLISQDAGEKIRALQQERDVLLDFIQKDMHKSAVLGTRLETETKLFRATEAALVDVSTRAGEGESAVREMESVREDLRLRRLEIEELTKMEAELVAQGRSKQEILVRVQSELATAQAKNTEYEAQVQVLREDGRVLRQDLGTMQEDSEKLRRENGELRADVQRLQGACMQLEDLTAELSAMPVPGSATGTSPGLDMPEPVLDANGNLSTSALLPRSPSKAALASAGHAPWVGTPSLRLMSNALYLRVRELFKDLCTAESQVADMATALEKVQRRVSSADRDREAAMQQVGPLEENMQMAMVDFRTRVRDMESELLQLRPAQGAIERVRQALFDAPNIGDVLDPAVITGKVPILDSHLADVLSSLLSMSARTTAESLSRNSQILEVKDELASKVNELKEVRLELGSREEQLAAMLAREKRDESEREEGRRSARAALDGALDLTEKQNRLTSALERRIEATQKELQYRLAQIKTLGGREDTARVQLCDTLRRFSSVYASNSTVSEEPLPLGRIEAPSEDSKMPILQHWLNGLLQRVLGSMGLAASLPLTASGGGGAPMFATASGFANALSSSNTPAHALYTDAYGAVGGRGSPHGGGGGGGGVAPLSFHPDQDLATMDDDNTADGSRTARNNLQRRLEQAKSTFMALQEEHH
jgi:hypothetical protein